MRDPEAATVRWLTNLFLMVAEPLLLLRAILRFFNGNPDALFVHWVINVTDTLLIPFRGIFPQNGPFQSGWYVDFVALFAMAIYAVLGYLLMVLVGVLPSPMRKKSSRD